MKIERDKTRLRRDRVLKYLCKTGGWAERTEIVRDGFGGHIKAAELDSLLCGPLAGLIEIGKTRLANGSKKLTEIWQLTSEGWREGNTAEPIRKPDHLLPAPAPRPEPPRFEPKPKRKYARKSSSQSEQNETPEQKKARQAITWALKQARSGDRQAKELLTEAAYAGNEAAKIALNKLEQEERLARQYPDLLSNLDTSKARMKTLAPRQRIMVLREKARRDHAGPL